MIVSDSINKTGTIRARFLRHFTAGGKNVFTLNVDLELPGQGVSAIFGPSGSGKTTFLRCIAGLEKPEQGYLNVNGQCWQDEKKFLATHRRPLGYVFQEASLFPHLSAAGNLAYAVKRSSVQPDIKFYDRVVATLGIENILQRYPAQLSGGERQRVAIARSLLVQPRILLMDEPLASLDNARKREILPYLDSLHANFDIPIVYVSHSVNEVARLADTITVLDEGAVVSRGKFNEVFSRIDSSLDFEEEAGAVIQAQVAEKSERWHLTRAVFDGGELWLRDSGEAVGQTLRIRILAKDVSLALVAHDDTSILNRLQAEITEISADRDEAMILVRLKTGAEYLLARVTRRSQEYLQLKQGKKLWAQIKSVAIVS